MTETELLLEIIRVGKLPEGLSVEARRKLHDVQLDKKRKDKAERKAIEAAAIKADTTDWSMVQKVCPRCQQSGFVDKKFGIRAVTSKFTGITKVTPQSWCNECRGKIDYHKTARTDRYDARRRR